MPNSMLEASHLSPHLSLCNEWLKKWSLLISLSHRWGNSFELDMQWPQHSASANLSPSDWRDQLLTLSGTALLSEQLTTARIARCKAAWSAVHVGFCPQSVCSHLMFTRGCYDVPHPVISQDRKESSLRISIVIRHSSTLVTPRKSSWEAEYFDIFRLRSGGRVPADKEGNSQAEKEWPLDTWTILCAMKERCSLPL